jgi:hypothetical protein
MSRFAMRCSSNQGQNAKYPRTINTFRDRTACNSHDRRPENIRPVNRQADEMEQDLLDRRVAEWRIANIVQDKQRGLARKNHQLEGGSCHGIQESDCCQNQYRPLCLPRNATQPVDRAKQKQHANDVEARILSHQQSEHQQRSGDPVVFQGDRREDQNEAASQYDLGMREQNGRQRNASEPNPDSHHDCDRQIAC